MMKVDLVIKNASVLNIFSKRWMTCDLAVQGHKVIGFDGYEGLREIDAKGRYIIPGLIDAHVHIESSMVTPYEFEKMVLPLGTTTVIADPHEIANVLGIEGLRYMIESAENCVMDIFINLPSCVPATPFEHSGAQLATKDLALFANHEKVLGLGEMMNFYGVLNEEEDVMEKLNYFNQIHKPIDGHAPGLVGRDLDLYISHNIKTDHECETVAEMEEKIDKGMYVMIREGSAARNFDGLIKGVNAQNLNRILFCTDDRHPEDILREGHINNHIIKSLRQGISFIDAVQMASLNAAQCYGLKQLGALAPGYQADFIILKDLETFDIEGVYKRGIEINEAVFDDIKKAKHNPKLALTVNNTVHVNGFNKSQLRMNVSGQLLNVIEIGEGSLLTKKVQIHISHEDIDTDRELTEQFLNAYQLLKLYVLERHHGTGFIGKGYLKGIQMHAGAIAMTIAHDSHNIIVLGCDALSIETAIRQVVLQKGGIVLTKGAEILEALPLKVAGLMSEESASQVAAKLKKMQECIHSQLGVPKHVDPFLMLAFLALPVIPDIKLTDQGLFDVIQNRFIDLFE